MAELLTLLAVFAAGAGSFLSPCVLPVVPGYVAVLTGTTLATDASRLSQARVVRRSMQFVIGFLSTFVLLGASVSGIGQIGQEQRPLLQRVGGVLILVCGLALLVGSARVGLPRTWAPLGRWTRLGRGSPVVLGAAFALYWTPCATPILASILTLAATSGSPARGVGLLCCYAFGLGVLFVAVALGSNEALVAFRHMRRAGRAIEAVSGLVLLVTALALLTGGRLPLQ